jgi:hypothetical protein
MLGVFVDTSYAPEPSNLAALLLIRAGFRDVLTVSGSNTTRAVTHTPQTSKHDNNAAQ